MEISYGDWEGLTLPEIQARESGRAGAARTRQMGFHASPAANAIAMSPARVGDWYATVTRDTVVAAHGGVARALMANFHILPEEEATHADVLHGIVYVFSDNTMTRHVQGARSAGQGPQS